MSHVVCVVQARMGSTRLPGKILMDLCGKPVLARVLERAEAIAGVNELCLATTTDPLDNPVAQLGAAMFAEVVRGPERDVLARYVMAARQCNADVIVRITADCPLLDPEVSAATLRRHQDAAGAFGCKYTSNTIPVRTYPDGLDTEVFSRDALEHAYAEATEPEDREHVTPWMRRRLMTMGLEFGVDLSALRWTVDTAEDLARVRKIYAATENTAAPWSLATTLAAHLRVAGGSQWLTAR